MSAPCARRRHGMASQGLAACFALALAATPPRADVFPDFDGDRAITLEDLSYFAAQWKAAKAGGAFDERANLDGMGGLDRNDAWLMIEAVLSPPLPPLKPMLQARFELSCGPVAGPGGTTPIVDGVSLTVDDASRVWDPVTHELSFRVRVNNLGVLGTRSSAVRPAQSGAPGLDVMRQVELRVTGLAPPDKGIAPATSSWALPDLLPGTSSEWNAVTIHDPLAVDFTLVLTVTWEVTLPIAYVAQTGSSQPQLFLMDPDGTAQVQLTTGSGHTAPAGPRWCPAWSARSEARLVYEHSLGLKALWFTGLSSWVVYDEFHRYHDPCWSPDGAMLAVAKWLGSGPLQDLYTLPVANPGAEELLVGSDGLKEARPDWSPDGGQIAFARDGDIWIVNANGADPRPITAGPETDSDPRWSPDGRRIAFTRETSLGEAEVYVMRSDGTSPLNLTNCAGWDGSPTWSGDARMIAFVSSRDGGKDIFVMNADGSGQTNITNSPGDDEWGPSWLWPPVPGA